jgi:hypothetical protein
VPREPWRNGDFMGFHGISWGVATKLFDSWDWCDVKFWVIVSWGDRTSDVRESLWHSLAKTVQRRWTSVEISFMEIVILQENPHL